MSTPGDRRRSARRAAAAVALVLLVAAAPWAASPVRAASSPAVLVIAQSGSISADAAAAAVQSRVGGRVLDVRLVRRGGHATWRVKMLLPGGRVRVYRVDARSGRVLG